jgi:hypothetical protein
VAGIDGGDGGAEEVGVAGPQEQVRRQERTMRAAKRCFIGAVRLTSREEGATETDKNNNSCGQAGFFVGLIMDSANDSYPFCFIPS